MVFTFMSYGQNGFWLISDKIRIYFCLLFLSYKCLLTSINKEPKMIVEYDCDVYYQ